MASKPFTPEEARRIVQFLQKPAVFLNMTKDWPALQWTVEHLSTCLTERVRFRIGKRNEDMAPLFETECSYIEATVKEFLSWTLNEGESLVGPFSNYHCKEFWAYADYKYIAQLFQDKPAIFQRWTRQHTLDWHTGCQHSMSPRLLWLQSCLPNPRKRWHLFPPDDTPCLYPTRIPYEESSVFSQVSVVHPDLKKFPEFRRAQVHTVTLQPGQVLFVPRHWWHYVESVDPVTVSVNSWIELDMDDEARVGEALTKTIVCALKSVPSLDNNDHWLNPTEDRVSSHDENMQYLNLAVKACMDKRKDDTEGWSLLAGQPRAEAGKRDSSGLLKSPASPFVVPFGPHLIPVILAQKPECNCPKDKSCFKSNDPSQTKQRSDDEFCQRSGQHAQQEAGSPGTSEEGAGMHISTNDMLEFLVHPDVITLVTRLIMCRQRELQS
ncbi:HSPB1-associated protein 1 homolog isoform X2 [Megalobrama amblycephala]|uniref:HSPB1-associated protein 1 homolog isoform X2 n=1 Tax=Megalobrama amblycephala TaxID=75352 RepID=UPI0020143B02|nr:HSPB1-associated protein 1 homolog isoform X2 [Megalobrama amblycephala]